MRKASQAWRLPVSISIGVTAYPEHGNNPDRVFHAAEMANSAAKAAGKGRVVVAGHLHTDTRAARRGAT